MSAKLSKSESSSLDLSRGDRRDMSASVHHCTSLTLRQPLLSVQDSINLSSFLPSRPELEAVTFASIASSAEYALGFPGTGMALHVGIYDPGAARPMCHDGVTPSIGRLPMQRLKTDLTSLPSFGALSSTDVRCYD